MKDAAFKHVIDAVWMGAILMAWFLCLSMGFALWKGGEDTQHGTEYGIAGIAIGAVGVIGMVIRWPMVTMASAVGLMVFAYFMDILPDLQYFYALPAFVMLVGAVVQGLAIELERAAGKAERGSA